MKSANSYLYRQEQKEEIEILLFDCSSSLGFRGMCWAGFMECRDFSIPALLTSNLGFWAESQNP